MEGQEVPRNFRRRRPPSPQATRLMIFALVASIGLAAVLSFVFLPVLFFWEEQSKDPHYVLAAIPEGERTRIVVVGSTFPRQLGYFDVMLLVDSQNYSFGPISDGMEGMVSFSDANGNGILDEGDYFLVEVEPGRTYTFLILPREDPERGGVGFIKWTA
jgi:hypothetical protein